MPHKKKKKNINAWWYVLLLTIIQMSALKLGSNVTE